MTLFSPRLHAFGTTVLSLLLLTGTALAQNPKAKPKAKPKQPAPQREATPADALKTLPGFQVELLHTADPTTEGSWINMAKDHKGRLIISGQQNQPMLRVTIADGKVAQIEKLTLPITGAMGILDAFGSLYVNGIGPKGFGLYRCRDTTGDDQYDSVELLKAFAGAGEHGPHGLAVGPDGLIYVMNGNHTKVPDGVASDSPHRGYQEDQLLPRQWDGNGHATGILAPGGYVVRTDPDGKHWELVLAGFRNAYDIAFNADGEAFTFDSDMEWDWGMPWYRPVRVNHCVSAAEFGWRSGTGKWPASYPDSLPAVTDIGIGSPTGVGMGTGAKFPAKYQKAFYILDWTYGRVIAVHLVPKGASYTATFENFLAPAGLTDNVPKKPLNVTDLVIGNDGAMYVTTGGRNTQAALYRVSYTGKESTAAADLTNKDGAAERATRKSLEKFHGKVDPGALAAAWPYLGNPDRFLRYAARIAVESQPLETWKAKALAETNPQAALTALLALARMAPREDQAALLTALGKLPFDSLTPQQQIEKLRVLGLSFIRQGRPSVEQARAIIAELDPRFPGPDDAVNREVAQVLIYLNAPGIAAKGLKLMAKATTQEEMFHYLFHLRTLPIGFWTLDQRKEYLSYWMKDRPKRSHLPEVLTWFAEAGRPYGDGSSYANFLKNFLREAVQNMSESEKAALSTQLAAIDKAAIPDYNLKPREVVKDWTSAELLPLLAKADKGRNFEKGRVAYLAGQCIKCHRFGNDGGAVGPDLTAVASRYSRKEILEAILEPSKVISDQYQNEVIATASGKVVTGRVVDETEKTIAVQSDPLSPERVTIDKDDIETRKPSTTSPMPAHLVDVLTMEEVLDLLAYLEASGRKNAPAFQK